MWADFWYAIFNVNSVPVSLKPHKRIELISSGMCPKALVPTMRDAAHTGCRIGI
jgi:hypothetical protein